MCGTRRERVWGIALLAAVAVTGCAPADETAPTADSPPAAAPAATGEVIATYDGKALRSDDVVEELRRLPAPSRAYLASPEHKRQFVENLVMNELLYEEGRRAGYDRDPEIERQVTALRKRLVVQRVMRAYQTLPEIADERVRAEYDAHPDLYSTTQIRASHILVRDEATAKAILAELRANPTRFAEVAREKSIDAASAKQGGDLGRLRQGRMVPEFERVAFALAEDQISDVVKTTYGYHVIQVTERIEGERRPFDEVKEQIRARLRSEAQQARLEERYDGLKRAANLTIDDAALARVKPPPGPAPGIPRGVHGH